MFPQDELNSLITNKILYLNINILQKETNEMILLPKTAAKNKNPHQFGCPSISTLKT